MLDVPTYTSAFLLQLPRIIWFCFAILFLFIVNNLKCLTLSQLLIGLIVFSSFWQLFEYLVYLYFSSIYFSMCFLQNNFLRITLSYFHKLFSTYKSIVSNSLFNIPRTTRNLFRIFKHHHIITIMMLVWWAQMESNHRPHAYQACALTIWAMSPYFRVVSSVILFNKEPSLYFSMYFL